MAAGPLAPASFYPNAGAGEDGELAYQSGADQSVMMVQHEVASKCARQGRRSGYVSWAINARVSWYSHLNRS